MELSNSLTLSTDNIDNIDVLANLLLAEGVSSTALDYSGSIHEQVLQLERVDIAFVDLEMPQVDGYEVLDIIKVKLSLDIPVVAYTVHISEMNVAREMGFDAFLGKPLDPDLFGSHLARILNWEAVWEIGYD